MIFLVSFLVKVRSKVVQLMKDRKHTATTTAVERWHVIEMFYRTLKKQKLTFVSEHEDWSISC